MNTIVKKCAYCGAEFETLTPSRKYCCNEHKFKAHPKPGRNPYEWLDSFNSLLRENDGLYVRKGR